MQTRKVTDETTQLPPPPAPTARDANPWTVEAEPGKASPRHRFRRRVAGGDQDPVRRRSGSPGFAVVIAIALLMLGVAVLRERQGGDFEDLAGAVFAMIVLILFAVTRRRDRKSSAPRHDDGEGESG